MSEPQTPAATDPVTPAVEPTTPTEPIKLPDDHPLVTALAAQKEKNQALQTQLEAHGSDPTTEERVAALEERTRQAERAALVARVQAKHGISDDDAGLYLTAADEATLEKQGAGLAARSDASKSKNYVPNEGKTPKPGDDNLRDFTRNLFNRD